jgi:hypothetical protein
MMLLSKKRVRKITEQQASPIDNGEDDTEENERQKVAEECRSDQFIARADADRRRYDYFLCTYYQFLSFILYTELSQSLNIVTANLHFIQLCTVIKCADGVFPLLCQIYCRMALNSSL